MCNWPLVPQSVGRSVGRSDVLLYVLVTLVRLLYADPGRIVGHQLNNAERSIYITREI